LELFVSSKIKPEGTTFLQKFLQKMVNRFFIGFLRYAGPHGKQLYLSRLQKELKAYKRTGNQENLINVAVYCVLESIAPEHPKHHHNEIVDSVTRKQYGGNVE